ncbi:MAG: DNA-processing protein DprA, partial [Rhodospirillales bacterium]
VLERGVIISEMPVGTRFIAGHFPRRKRIISGIFRGIVVIEAAPKSGFIITACSVLEQNRGVFAMPGSPADPRARGTNNLI